MRIAFVTQALPYLPARDGFRMYAANLIRCLARRHELDLVSLLHEEDRAQLEWCRRHCAAVTLIPAGRPSMAFMPVNFLASYLWGKPLRYRRPLAAALHRGQRERNWNVLHVEGGYACGLVPGDLPLPKIASLHDSWTLRCDQTLKATRSLKEKLYYAALRCVEPRYERLVFPQFDRCVVVAEHDRRSLCSTVPKCRVAVVPLGVDTDYFRPAPSEKHPAVMTFHGRFDYPPNVDAVLEFMRDVFPLIRRARADAAFHLVGANPPKQIRQLAMMRGVRVWADVPDLRPILGASSVYVCPVRYGSGQKFKLLEAMAMQLPIVSHPGAIAGMDHMLLQHVLVAGDAVTFAKHVLALLREPQRAAQIARAGRELVEKQHSWESRARDFEELYEQSIAERGAPLAPRTTGYRSLANSVRNAGTPWTARGELQ